MRREEEKETSTKRDEDSSSSETQNESLLRTVAYLENPRKRRIKVDFLVVVVIVVG
jgi:hypothetical protein